MAGIPSDSIRLGYRPEVKVLAFTDPHGDVRNAVNVVRMAAKERPDVVVCAGDFSFLGNNWRGLIRELSRMGRKIHLVGGNHEADGLMRSLVSEYPFLVDVAYTTAEENGVLVGGVPGYDRDFWPSKRTDDGAVAMIRDIWGARDRSKPFIFLTHYPPSGAVDGLSAPTPDAGGSATVASAVRAIEPDLVVTGHYHQDFGSWGRIGRVWIVNPGPSGHILTVKRDRMPLGLP